MEHSLHTGGGQTGSAEGWPDPLAELERRWELLASMVRSLREENGTLRERLQVCEGHVGRIEHALAEKREEVAALQETERRTNERINGLLARFEVTEP